MPEPLVSEDSDLQRLLGTVHSEPGAEILYQDRVRRGGVFGFFAREVHRVAYRIATEADGAETAAAGTDLPQLADLSHPGDVPHSDDPPQLADLPQSHDLPQLEDLLASVEAAESAGQQPAFPAAQPPRHDFAALLRTLTDADPSADEAPVITERLSPRPAAAAPARQTASRTNVTAFGRPDARARLEMLMQLRQVGVPVSVNPRADTHSLYEALENILEDLPAPAVPPRGAGQVLAVVGESGPALQAAHTCAAMLRIPQNSIGVAGMPEHSGASRDYRDYPVISGRQEALRLRTDLSATDLPSVVVIATDATEAGSDDPWAAEILAALRPTAIWAVVDARWKTEDSRAQLDRLGRVDALVVHSAQLSASPASVWDFDLPLGLLDGRAASTFAWLGLLFPLLRTSARHRASA
ncbi:hypothetical protein [Jatrophihabitans sp.]|jgi:hypothetical protein|uniref:hypothetical protein n=1 Tax=Jatrophihabitans sp. TaxID=1932789 RepID=UPI002F2181EB